MNRNELKWNLTEPVSKHLSQRKHSKYHDSSPKKISSCNIPKSSYLLLATWGCHRNRSQSSYRRPVNRRRYRTYIGELRDRIYALGHNDRLWGRALVEERACARLHNSWRQSDGRGGGSLWLDLSRWPHHGRISWDGFDWGYALVAFGVTCRCTCFCGLCILVISRWHRK
jgi:hypothetical protein